MKVKQNYETLIGPSCHVNKNQGPASRTAKPYETRPNWALGYPNRKRADWQSDYCSVLRLSESGERYWLNIWENRDDLRSRPKYFVVRLKAKEGGSEAKPYSCRLRDSVFHPGKYVSTLRLNGVRYEVALWEDVQPQPGPCYLRVHFELEKDIEA
jgi:hypothetical protein